MVVFETAHRVVNNLAQWPVLGNIARRQYDRAFEANRDQNLFRNVFDSFEAAQNSAPVGRSIGYDNPDSAKMYVDRTRKIYPTDYPVIYWLQQLFEDGCTSVFDVGGHIGVSYYAYRKYLKYPHRFTWTVHDVPAVMAEGRRIAIEKDTATYLRFSDNFNDCDGVDVLFALGSLQYLPETLYGRLANLTIMPRYLLLNLTPLHERESFFTLQSIGTTFCPYRITAVGTFLKGIGSLGYKLLDTWDNPDKKCEIPFHPEYSLERYHGFCFKQMD